MESLPRAVHIPLTDEVADALYQLSRREYRHPRQQATFLLVEGLRRAGLLTPEPENDRQLEVVNATAD